MGRKALLKSLLTTVVVSSCLSLAACWQGSGNHELFRETRVLMGTSVQIAVAASSETRAREAMARAFAAMEAVDREMSWSNPDGQLARTNARGSARHREIGPGLATVVEAALGVASDSDGAFDPTIGALTRIWRFEEGGVVPDSHEIAEAAAQVGWSRIEFERNEDAVVLNLNGAQLDLGAIAKGYAIDLATESLEGDGIASGIVDAGGDLRLIGTRPGGAPWRIGVQDPRDPARLIARMSLADTAVVTSGDYERTFTAAGTTYHHILDPRTGMPARGCRSVTVVAPSATEADACATAAFVLGPERGAAFLRSRAGIRGLLIASDGGMTVIGSGLIEAAE